MIKCLHAGVVEIFSVISASRRNNQLTGKNEMSERERPELRRGTSGPSGARLSSCVCSSNISLLLIFKLCTQIEAPDWNRIGTVPGVNQIGLHSRGPINHAMCDVSWTNQSRTNNV